MAARAKRMSCLISAPGHSRRGLRAIRQMMHRVGRKNLMKKKGKPTSSSVLMACNYRRKARRHQGYVLGLISFGLFQEDSCRSSGDIIGWSALSTASRRVLYRYLRCALRDCSVEMIALIKTNMSANIKKLHLVLDLDNTLLHTVNTNEMLCEEDGVEESGDLFIIEEKVTKLRPFLGEFLREANAMFEMTVYTMGGKHYGRKIVQLIDPDGLYFGDRVITREDCTQKGRKSLDVIPAEESDVIIIDDRAKVWPDHARNLIQIEPYYYFPTKAKEGREDVRRALRTILKRLQRIYDCYSWAELGFGGTKDVRVLLQCIEN